MLLPAHNRLLIVYTALFCLCLAFTGHSAKAFISKAPKGLVKPEKTINPNLHDIYMYQVQPMNVVNWVYDGLAPRMEDPSRVRVYLSKRGYTMRVHLQFNPQEIAAYPKYLVERAATVDQAIRDRGLTILQTNRYKRYQDTVAQIARELDMTTGFSNDKYRQGLNLLVKLFPDNIRIETRDAREEIVHLHMVYPITIHRSGQLYPPARDYRMFLPVEERRSRHCSSREGGKCGSYDHIFSGFPAFWIHPDGAGVGVHGPIRYSKFSDEAHKIQEPGYNNLSELWADNNFLGDGYTSTEQISPTYRWDLVRTNNSKGCFRSESLELRHLLPSDPYKVSQVVWTVLDNFDRVVMEPSKGLEIVNVNYYVLSPYKKQLVPYFDEATQMWQNADWFIQHYLTESERKSPNAANILNNLLNQVRNFPYHDPHALEFKSINGDADEPTMRHLNRTPYQDI